MGEGTITGSLQPDPQAYQQCFIAHSHRAPWRQTIVRVCDQVLPRFGLQPWYANRHFDATTSLREKIVEMIATTRYGIYDLSYWRQAGKTGWEMPSNVLIELGMAIALNRPILLLRHAENRACGLPLPACLQGIAEQIHEFTGGERTLRDAFEAQLPQWTQHPPEQDWLNRYCTFGGLVCSYREVHPQAQQWSLEKFHCHISDGADIDREDFRDALEQILRRFSDIHFEYLDACSIPKGYQYLLCSHCQRVRSSPFSVYRITPDTAADTFIAIGMSIALEAQFGYKIPKILITTDIHTIPSLLSGYEVLVASDFLEIKERLKQLLPQVIQKIRHTAWKPRPLPFEVFTPPKERAEDEIPEIPRELHIDAEEQLPIENEINFSQQMPEEYYIDGIERLKQILRDKRSLSRLHILEERLYENTERRQSYGENEDTRLDWIKIISELTLLSNRELGIDFIGLCQPADTKLLEERDNNEENPSVGSVLRNILKNDPAEITRVARELGVNERSIRRWMNGELRPRANILRMLPDVLPKHRIALTDIINRTFPDALYERPINIFISYAHEDRQWHDRLMAHLSVLRRQGLITIWSNREVHPGSNIKDEIFRHLEEAEIILLLVSADLLASDDLSETERILERMERGEVRVIPIILRPTDWESTSFSQLVALPRNRRPISSWSNQDEAFLNIITEISDVIDNMRKR